MMPVGVARSCVGDAAVACTCCIALYMWCDLLYCFVHVV